MTAMFPQAHTVLDLFSGAVGGWTYACKWAGLEVVAACEIDPWRRQVYSAVHHAGLA
jgi:site-specific DNA-cytosine methylase